MHQRVHYGFIALEEINLYFELKGTPESSKEPYRRRLQAFIRFMQDRDKCMEELSEKDIQQYILYLKREKGLTAGTINNYVSAIKFFYTYVLDKEWNPRKIPRMKRIAYFPVIPPKQDVLAILNATTNLKHKAILHMIYGSGLRVSEVAKLRICDICSKGMRVRVEHAKHDTNRYTILSETALVVLRNYFRAYFAPGSYKPEDWLFPGQNRIEHINVKTIKNTIIKLRNKLQLDLLAGGLDKINKWHSTSKKFFIPVKVLSKKFRGKFLHYLKAYHRQDLLKFYGDSELYQNPKLFRKLLDLCYAKKWYSYLSGNN